MARRTTTAVNLPKVTCIDLEVADVKERKTINTGIPFEIISLRTPYHYGDFGKNSEPGLSDKTMHKSGASTNNLDKMVTIQYDRAQSRKTKEIIVSREVLKHNLTTKPLSFPITEKQATREFLLVTYPGWASYLANVWKNHKPGHCEFDYHRLATFHETIGYEPGPSKLFVDFDYTPSKIRTNIDGQTFETFDITYGKVDDILSKLISRLNDVWKSKFVAGSDYKNDLQYAKIRHVVYDATRYPGLSINDPTAKPTWKISFHLIWFVEGVRFNNITSVMAFLKLAVDEAKNNSIIEWDAINVNVNGLDVIDFKPYSGKSFRAPYCCKTTCSTEGVLCPPLLPIPKHMDEHSLVNYNKHGTSDTFNPELFFFGLTRHIPPYNETSSLMDGYSEEVLFLINTTSEILAKERMGIEHFESSINLMFGREDIQEYMDKYDPVTDQERSEMDMAIYRATSDETLSIATLIREATNELSRVVTDMCFYRTKGKFGYPFVELHGIAFKNISPRFDVIVYRCSTRTKGGHPCLARRHDEFRPHSMNHNFVVFNIHTHQWYMSCFNTNCIRTYLRAIGIPDTEKLSDKVVIEMGIKAKTEIFEIGDHVPELMFYTITLSKKLHIYKMIAARQEMEPANKRETLGSSQEEDETDQGLEPSEDYRKQALKTMFTNAKHKEDKSLDSMIDSLLYAV